METMKAMILSENASVETRPLRFTELPLPRFDSDEILVKVSTCGVCHTELDEIEGRLKPNFPVILGHEIIGNVVGTGVNVSKFKIGNRAGIAWIYSACDRCGFCRSGLENLCPDFSGTGCDANGGYAEYVKVKDKYAYPIPVKFNDVQAAPLLCAGAIGYRDYKLSGIQTGQVLGLFGFGASAHIVLQLALHYNIKVFVFTRGEEHRNLALKLGATWAGGLEDEPPSKVNCAIDFTPVGETIPQALQVLEKGGRLVIAVIRKRNRIPSMDYARLLWDEKEIKSVANITRKDIEEFLTLAAGIHIITEVKEFSLDEANEALILLKQGKISGAAVLNMRK